MAQFTYQSKAELVADAIRELVKQGDLGPGSVLRQRELAERFRVSATPVREALRMLETEGLVVNEVHRGATVVTPNQEDKEETYAIRAVLEPMAGKLAAERITEDEIAELTALHEQIADLSADDPAITDLNRRFHMRMYECARSPVLLSLIRTLWNNLHGGPQVVWRPQNETVAQHREMIEALERRDGDAVASVVRKHIDGAIAHMRRHVSLQDGPGPEPG